MHLVDVWPLHSLRLTTADLELRPTTEAELPALCAILPPDLEADPTSTRYAGLDDRANQRAVLAQSYWRAMGTWSPHDWVLPFAVRHGGELVGMQALEGPDWTAERTVDSWSWLAVGARGQGWGKQMRAAVLALAFGPLGARAAISSAVVDNLVVAGRLARPRLSRHPPLRARALGPVAAPRPPRARALARIGHGRRHRRRRRRPVDAGPLRDGGRRVSTPGLGTGPDGIPERGGLGAAVQRQLEGASTALHARSLDDTDRPVASVRGLDEVTDASRADLGARSGTGSIPLRFTTQKAARRARSETPWGMV